MCCTAKKGPKGRGGLQEGRAAPTPIHPHPHIHTNRFTPTHAHTISVSNPWHHTRPTKPILLHWGEGAHFWGKPSHPEKKVTPPDGHHRAKVWLWNGMRGEALVKPFVHHPQCTNEPTSGACAPPAPPRGVRATGPTTLPRRTQSNYPETTLGYGPECAPRQMVKKCQTSILWLRRDTLQVGMKKFLWAPHHIAWGTGYWARGVGRAL